MIRALIRRWTHELIWSGEAADVRDAVQQARASDADLTDADLTDADLTDADLTDAVLTDAVLTDAVLTRAVLTRADLTRADLTRADLTDAKLPAGVPVIPQIDAAILAAIEQPGARLEMSDWHGGTSGSDACGTTHCRAGWAITLAGDAGRELERRVGPAVAGALIYAASGSHPVPDFFANNDEAIADMRARAAAAAQEST